ncbi:hypothetical protein FGL98_03610 [Leekyejoonella antrihumi]|uniref:YbhB/YbcL family Raf kinase inhibitor-like protein n=2 Tax=Leekyejoonella antrihumi TaxID=1660198 RepID=A0A563E6X2_9MICO|nr:YbhB/YbcL family Raf kinase inhibitor-like protein [Leekyejoonella antrihumi]TWP38308.1 hypothetical protein FGL98_03610 [Leekyejoonella antrihumi]
MGYQGPRPLPGDGPHHYVVHLFAPDTHLDFAAIKDRANLPAAAAGHVLGTQSTTTARLLPLIETVLHRVCTALHLPGCRGVAVGGAKLAVKRRTPAVRSRRRHA